MTATADSELDEAGHASRKATWRTFFLLAGLFLFFFCYYVINGLAMARTCAFVEYDVLFESDSPRVIIDVTGSGAKHYRANVHPLYILLMNPLGQRLLAGGLFESTAAVCDYMNSFIGALNVLGAFLFFRLRGRPRLDALLLSSLFGVSASHFFLTAVPETSPPAVCSLIVTYILFLRAMQGGKVPFAAWVAAGVFSIGITITNFAQTAICFVLCQWTTAEGKPARVAVRTACFCAATLFCAGVLSAIQNVIYPTAPIFYVPANALEELQYLSAYVLQDPLKVFRQLLRSFFLINFTLPIPDRCQIENVTLAGVTFRESWNYTSLGWMSVASWFCFMLAAVVQLVKKPAKPLFCVGLVLCVLFNMAVHCFYGVGKTGIIELIVYSGNFTFLVLALLTCHEVPWRTAGRVLLGTLVLLIGLNNYFVFQHIVAIYR